jgi:hypothetical protein
MVDPHHDLVAIIGACPNDGGRSIPSEMGRSLSWFQRTLIVSAIFPV